MGFPGAFQTSATLCIYEEEDEETGETSCEVEGNLVVTGSPNVFTNNKYSARVGDNTGSTPPDHPCSIIKGSSNVFINHSNAARVEPRNLSCACENLRGSITSGSPNVFIGG